MINEQIKCSLTSIEGVAMARGDEDYASRIMNFPMSKELNNIFSGAVKTISVTNNFKEIIDYFKVESGTPAGFRLGFELKKGGLLEADLVRDVAYDKNCEKRPTDVLYSCDSVNPAEVNAIKDMLACLTCNPAILYSLFINNPKANIGGKYKNRDEVIKDIAKIIGPGVDMTVELNDPFRKSESELLEEVAHFEEILGKWRFVVKVPHTGPVNAENVSEILTGDKMFQRRYNEGTAADHFRGHNLVLMLKEHGYRSCLTLMYEPYQASLGLQARPAYITCFMMFRQKQAQHMKGLLASHEMSGDMFFLEQLRKFMVENDYLAAGEGALDLYQVKTRAEYITNYRGFTADGFDGFEGLDLLKHSLNVLRTCHTDTRTILCNFQGEELYPYIDQVLYSGEYDDVLNKVVITTSPTHLAQFTSSPLVVQFHRRFMNAAAGQK